MIKSLLDFIAAKESRGDYNAVWGGILKKHHPSRPLVQMTIGEVLAWQDKIDPLYRSEAAGRYQILEDTLRGLYAEAGLTVSSLFDVAGQDALAIQLLKRRGLRKFQSGQISAETFANNLAHEWASLPLVNGPNKGKSVYDGDGLNKSLVGAEAFLKVVRSVALAASPAPLPPKAAPIPVPKPQPSAGFWADLFRAMAAIFGKGK